MKNTVGIKDNISKKQLFLLSMCLKRYDGKKSITNTIIPTITIFRPKVINVSFIYYLLFHV